MTVDCSVLFDLLRIVVNRNDEKIKRMVDGIFDIYMDTTATTNSSDTKYCELYITLCKEIIGNQLNITDHKIDLTNIFKRHLTSQIFKKDIYVRDALKSVIETELSPSRISDITQRMNNIIAWHVSKKYIQKLYGQLKDSNLSYSPVDQNESINTVRNLVDEFKTSMSDINSVTGRGGPIESIDMSNINSIRTSFKLFKERRVNHILKTGLQGLNQMCGPSGGIALGESVLFAARTHHFKSGMLMKMVQWVADHSKPPKTPGKTPMILVVSLENEGYQNMMKLFKEMYISCHGTVPPVTMSDEEMVNSIYEFFNKTDYVLVIERYLPTEFGADEFIALLDKYESSGFKVIAAVVDYVGLMKTHNRGSMSKSGDATLLQELYNKVVNYCKATGTTLFTGHQLNRGASDIAASGIPHPVKYYSERHFAGSTGIAREVDMLVYMEIENDEQGNAWLTMNWGKHRYVDDTLALHKFVAYQFDPVLGIQDDIDKTFAGCRNIYKKSESAKATVDDINAILGL